GRPHADSDVDLLVIMPCRNQLDQAFKIRLAVERRFPLDLIVRTPHNMKWRLAEGDDFFQEIVAKGTVLYEAPDGRMAKKSLSGCGAFWYITLIFLIPDTQHLRPCRGKCRLAGSATTALKLSPRPCDKPSPMRGCCSAPIARLRSCRRRTPSGTRSRVTSTSL